MLPPGRLVELSGGQGAARTTAAVSLVTHAHAGGELVAWVQPEGGPLYPPDLASSGVDLGSLVCVHVPRRAGPHGITRATELLVRSGAFGLVITDLTEGAPPGQARWQGRLSGVAREHDTKLVLLTHKSSAEASLGPLVGVRVEPRRTRTGPERFTVEHAILKAKMAIDGTPSPEDHGAPSGVP